MNKLVMGILAHVDAGKTTISEALLYDTGAIRQQGRVDKRDTFLDTHELERERGITIFSKQAVFKLPGMTVTLVDTPGHADFGAEMERTLCVLDIAVLVISAADGIQSHTRVLWDLLKNMNIPVFIFVNKMDISNNSKDEMLEYLRHNIGGESVDFTVADGNAFYESVAVCNETLLDKFIENNTLTDKEIASAIKERNVFPCYFGSALKNEGVKELLQGINRFAEVPDYSCNKEFGAKVFKISRDGQSNRLTHLKVTGGVLRVKDVLSYTDNNDGEGSENGSSRISEKVNQIRVYSGGKYETVTEAGAGSVVAVTGLSKTAPGQCLGCEHRFYESTLQPILMYNLVLPEGTDPVAVLRQIKPVVEEIPELNIVWDENTKQIRINLMGEVQTEIIKRIIAKQLGINVEFGEESIVYKETISDRVEGVGHFEPLKHYAEVHLLMEPGRAGSGLVFDTDVSEDELALNWQRLILTHLKEKVHLGVLTGAPVTDMKITLVAGKAHKKHTEGGDFRQATYRAVRQGLMQAESVLLEPYYSYRLEIPETVIGRAMTDMERMGGTFSLEPLENADAYTDGKMRVVTGSVPVSTVRNYQREVMTYTKGTGKITCVFEGYKKCHNAQEVIEAKGYDPENDLSNPSGSVFCSHGSGFNVTWNHVKEYMHIESISDREKRKEITGDAALMDAKIQKHDRSVSDEPIGIDEINKILNETYYANANSKNTQRKKWTLKNRDYFADSTGSIHKNSSQGSVKAKWSEKSGKTSRRRYMLVDGYNVIFAWNELNELAKINIDGARGRLLDILCNYQAMTGYDLIAVFDAYRVKGHDTEVTDFNNIHVVFTKEAETADAYIEKFAHENGEKHDVTVVTSDGLEQIIIRGAGCQLISSREFEIEVHEREEYLRQNFLK